LGFNGDMSNEHKFLLIFAEKKEKKKVVVTVVWSYHDGCFIQHFEWLG